MALITLCTIPELSIDYQHTVDFNHLSSQYAWFTRRAQLTVEGNFRADTMLDTVTLNTPLQNIKACDYLLFNNEQNKTMYYFITEKIQRTESSCVVNLMLDVFQTFMFDYSFLDCFVERCHQRRWVAGSPDEPVTNITDEGLPLSDYKTYSLENAYPLNKSYIMCSTTPLGEITSSPTPGGTGGDPVNGIPSAKGYRFIKGYEGFAKSPYYGSGESFRTSGYGITENYQAKYFAMLQPFPTSEQKASEVYGEMLIDAFGKPLSARMKADGVDLAQVDVNQYSAFCSLAMNGGLGAVTSSPMYSKWLANPQDPTIGTDWLTWYTTAGGVELPGLVARRGAESKIFATGVYTMRPIITVNSDGSYGPAVTDNDGNGYIPPIFGGLGD